MAGPRGPWPAIVGEWLEPHVETMHLSPINPLFKRLIFKHMLLKRAYSQERFTRMASLTPFKSCDVRADPIGLEVSLTKYSADRELESRE